MSATSEMHCKRSRIKVSVYPETYFKTSILIFVNKYSKFYIFCHTQLINNAI